MGKFLIGGWELILPVCSGTSALDRGATLTARWLHEPREISNHLVGLGFPQTPGRYRPVGCAFSSSICLGCRYIGEFLTRRCELILPVCGETSALDRGATLTARWPHEPRAIINNPVGLGFPHTPGRYRPGVCALSSYFCLGCTCISEFLTRRCGSILPVCGGTSALERGPIRTPRWLHEHRAIINHPVGLGFPHTPGRYRPGGCAFLSTRFWVIYICANF